MVFLAYYMHFLLPFTMRNLPGILQGNFFVSKTFKCLSFVEQKSGCSKVNTGSGRHVASEEWKTNKKKKRCVQFTEVKEREKCSTIIMITRHLPRVICASWSILVNFHITILTSSNQKLIYMKQNKDEKKNSKLQSFNSI